MELEGAYSFIFSDEETRVKCLACKLLTLFSNVQVPDPVLLTPRIVLMEK